MALTLDELITIATNARNESSLGGDTVVHLCEWEREYVPFINAKLEDDEDGAVFILII